MSESKGSKGEKAWRAKKKVISIPNSNPITILIFIKTRDLDNIKIWRKTVTGIGCRNEGPELGESLVY